MIIVLNQEKAKTWKSAFVTENTMSRAQAPCSAPLDASTS